MKKKLLIVVTLLVITVTLAACNTEMVTDIINGVMNKLGFNLKPLEIESIDTDATIAECENNGISVNKYTQSEYDIPDGIEFLKPDSIIFCYPESIGKTYESIEDLPVEDLIKIQAFSLMQYDTNEDAETAAKQAKEILNNITSDNIEDTLSKCGIDTAWSGLILLFKEHINIQTIDNQLVIYTSPAIPLIKDGNK